MENNHKEDLDKFVEENQRNLDALVTHILAKPNHDPKPKKFSIKWRQGDKTKLENPKFEQKNIV
jgi:hypothetical protein